MTLADLVPPRRDVAAHPTRTHPARSPDPRRDRPARPSDQHLVIRGLRVAPVADPEHEILQGIDLTVGKGEVHAIMGPNGSGKTTLAYALMGHPAYVVTGGEVALEGPRHPRSCRPTSAPASGLFLAFQYPTAIPGLSVA